MQKTLAKPRRQAQYSIQESGLAESTLRYYETVGILPHIDRDESSRHRRYSEKAALLTKELTHKK